MSNAIRSARGDLVNFELLAIKSQLAAVPVPKQVEERKIAIEERDGGKTEVAPAVSELLKVAETAASASASAKSAPKRK